MALPKDHPFSEFNEWFYLESGSPFIRMPIYIWKKGSNGILVEMYLNDRENGPNARVYSLLFGTEYDFNLGKTLHNRIIRKTDDELYSAVYEVVKEELGKL